MNRLSTWRDAALREMGLGPLWRLRARDAQLHTDAPNSLNRSSPSDPFNAPAAAATLVAAPPVTAPPVATRSVAIPSAMGPASSPSVAASEERARRIAGLGWDELEDDIRNCQACRLCTERQQAVPGSGDRQAAWLFVGEGPGREEDLRGLPFVGPAGELLDRMLAAIGLQRDQGVYIANAVKCRPPHNRIPEADEIAACRPYLLRQIELLSPRLIFVMGRPAAYSLFERAINISSARGRRIEHNGRTLVISYHPAYLLRNPQDKGKAWADLCLARELFDAEQDR